jgi:hypothetical protein
MRCKNPNSKISAENCETLETLGPKIQNARKYNLKLVGGALRRLYTPIQFLSPTSKFKVLKYLREGGSYNFFGNPRKVVRFCRKRMTGSYLCNGFFKTYALIPC